MLACMATTAMAQVPTEPTSVKSPNAASLGLYGEVPVSNFTGIPNIEIPLYTLEKDKTSFPISLSYHASGFRPDEHPGWVGMGWSLNAGGAISRSVNDMPDECTYPSWAYGTLLVDCGFFFNYNSIGSSTWDQSGTMQGLTRTDQCIRDTEPDEFSFSFAGHSGKFYMGHDGQWRVKCDQPVKVTVDRSSRYSMLMDVPFTAPSGSQPANYGGYFKSFKGFTITTGDGTQYVFGNSTDAIEYSIGFFNQLSHEWYADTWYLTSIIPVSSPTVTLTYEPDDYISQMYNSVYNIIAERAVGSDGNFLSSYSFGCSRTSFNPIWASYNGKLIRPVYLASVQSDGSEVLFDRETSTELTYDPAIYDYKYYDTQNYYLDDILTFLNNSPYSPPGRGYPSSLNNLRWKKLSHIRIRQQGQLLRSFDLGYNDNAAQRLTLLSVQEKGANGTAKPAYQLQYNNYQSLPPYLANKNDHWGFFNNNYAPILNNNTYYTAYYNYREPSTTPSVFLQGVLTQIKYPTGGVTDFQYEQHTYAYQVGARRNQWPVPALATDATAGGLRIRKISSYSPESPQQKLEKEYLYVSGYTPTTASNTLRSSGTLGGRVQYYFDDYRLTAYNYSANYSQAIFSSQSVLPAYGNSFGSHIGYSEVVEKRSDGSYGIYNYTNFENSVLDVAARNTLQPTRTVYEPYSSTSQERGNLTLERQFNSAAQLVKSRSIGYTTYASGGNYDARAVKAKFINICPSQNSIRVEEATAYQFFVYSVLPSSESETIYDENGQHPVTTSKSTAYNAFKMPSDISTYVQNKRLRTEIKYANDLPGSPFEGFGFALRDMAGDRHMVALPIETIRTVDDAIVGVTLNKYQTFDLSGMGTYSSYKVLPAEVNELETAQPLARSAYASPTWQTYLGGFGQSMYGVCTTDPKLNAKLTFTQYSPGANVRGLTKTGDVRMGYLWGYNQTLPVANITNAICTAPNYYDPKIGNEASYLGFESGTASAGTDANEDYWGVSETPGLNYFIANAHTGNYAWHLAGTGNFNYGPTRVFSPERQQLRYKLSGWVKTDAGFGNNDGRLVLAVNRQDGTQAGGTPNCYQAISFGDTNGKWRYIEVFLDLNAAHNSLGLPLASTSERLQVVAYAYNAGTTAFLIDDMRFQPAESVMTTYTHRPLVGVSSISDENSRPTYYEYDEFQRLTAVKDQEGNIIKANSYNYRP